MGIVGQLVNITNYILYGVIIFMVIAGGAFIFFYKFRKKGNALQEDTTDYSGLNRKDSKDYLKFDDIDDNMIITEGGTRFIGVIKCQGFEFYSASAAEQAATSISYNSFMDTLRKPITYREYSKAVDLEDFKKRYEKAYSEVEEQLYNAIEDQKELLNSLRDENLTMEEVALYEKELMAVQKKIDSLNFREFHIRDEITYIERNSGNHIAPETEQTYVFEWSYKEMSVAVDMSKEEIYKRAIQELHALASAMIHSLGNAHVKARRCTTEELIEMCRLYSCPISANRFKLRDLMNSSVFEDIVTSDSIDEMKDRMKQLQAEDMRDAMGKMIMGYEN